MSNRYNKQRDCSKERRERARLRFGQLDVAHPVCEREKLRRLEAVFVKGELALQHAYAAERCVGLVRTRLHPPAGKALCRCRLYEGPITLRYSVTLVP